MLASCGAVKGRQGGQCIANRARIPVKRGLRPPPFPTADCDIVASRYTVEGPAVENQEAFVGI